MGDKQPESGGYTLKDIQVRLQMQADTLKKPLNGRYHYYKSDGVALTLMDNDATRETFVALAAKGDRQGVEDIYNAAAGKSTWMGSFMPKWNPEDEKNAMQKFQIAYNQKFKSTPGFKPINEYGLVDDATLDASDRAEKYYRTIIANKHALEKEQITEQGTYLGVDGTGPRGEEYWNAIQCAIPTLISKDISKSFINSASSQDNANAAIDYLKKHGNFSFPAVKGTQALPAGNGLFHTQETRKLKVLTQGFQEAYNHNFGSKEGFVRLDENGVLSPQTMAAMASSYNYYSDVANGVHPPRSPIPPQQTAGYYERFHNTNPKQPAQANPRNLQPPKTVQQPVQNQPVQNQPVQNQPVQNQPVQNQPVQNQPVQNQPVHNQPAHNQPVQNQPVHNQPVQNQPVHNQPVHNQPVHNQPVHNQPVHNQHSSQAHQQPHPQHHARMHRAVHYGTGDAIEDVAGGSVAEVKKGDIGVGAVGSPVRDLQTMLKYVEADKVNLGHTGYNTKNGIDNDYGKLTQAAVKLYQKEKGGLDENGTADEKTRTALKADFITAWNNAHTDPAEQISATANITDTDGKLKNALHAIRVELSHKEKKPELIAGNVKINEAGVKLNASGVTIQSDDIITKPNIESVVVTLNSVGAGGKAVDVKNTSASHTPLAVDPSQLQIT